MPTYYDELLPYQKNQQIWICPSDLANPSNDPHGKPTLKPPAMGYHMNGNVITKTGLAEAVVAAPSNCLLMRESGAGSVWFEAYLRPYPGTAMTRSSSAPTRCGWARTDGRALTLTVITSCSPTPTPNGSGPRRQRISRSFRRTRGKSLQINHKGATRCSSSRAAAIITGRGRRWSHGPSGGKEAAQ